MEWISINSQTPPEGETILMCYGQMSPKYEVGLYRQRINGEDVTHWAALSDPVRRPAVDRPRSRKDNSRRVVVKSLIADLDRILRSNGANLIRLITPIPRDAELISVYFDNLRRELRLVYSHESFAELGMDEPLPSARLRFVILEEIEGNPDQPAD